MAPINHVKANVLAVPFLLPNSCPAFFEYLPEKKIYRAPSTRAIVHGIGTLEKPDR